MRLTILTDITIGSLEHAASLVDREKRTGGVILGYATHAELGQCCLIEPHPGAGEHLYAIRGSEGVDLGWRDTLAVLKAVEAHHATAQVFVRVIRDRARRTVRVMRGMVALTFHEDDLCQHGDVGSRIALEAKDRAESDLKLSPLEWRWLVDRLR